MRIVALLPQGLMRSVVRPTAHLLPICAMGDSVLKLV